MTDNDELSPATPTASPAHSTDPPAERQDAPIAGAPAPRSGAARIAPPAARPPSIARSLLRLAVALAVGYGALAGGLGYWQVVEAQRLSTDPRNPLMLQAARHAPRGEILDAQGNVLARNVGRRAEELRREYPFPVAAPVVGYRSLLFGTAGLERAYDGQLTGLRSLAPGDEFFRKFRSQPYDPADLLLSLDIRLQQAAADALGDDRGAVVAIEPSTGRVLAMASSPVFDPNRIADPARGRNYLTRLQGRADSPLLNRATQGLYVPGSVFKIVTAIAGIGSGAITADTTFENQPAEYTNGFLVEGFRIRDAPRSFQTDHPLDFYEATEVSSNIWFAHAGLEIGAPQLVDWARRLGFGARLPFELNTAPSLVTSGDGPLSGFTDRVELANAAYGQGEVLVTPLQMALVAAAIANDGVLMQPKLVDEVRMESGAVTRIRPRVMASVLPSAEAVVVGEAMRRAVEGEYGRHFAGGARIRGIEVAGKSGSAQLGDGSRPHSWFIGYAPFDDPQIAIAVIVERAGTGAGRAVPMGGQLMHFYLDLDD
ncbi:MAG: penicillin-binding protein 2 [Chloroflexota bacterium]|nr:penicillin-binding protein 2 [Chloroflexota bacterium]